MGANASDKKVGWARAINYPDFTWEWLVARYRAQSGDAFVTCWCEHVLYLRHGIG